MTENIYRVDVSMHFYIKGIDGYPIKSLVKNRIEENLILNKGLNINRVELPDDLKELYFNDNKMPDDASKKE